MLPPPADLVTAGSYAVETDIAVPATVLAPAEVAAMFEALQRTRTDPAGTWFALLEAAGVTTPQKLLGALPDVVEGRVKGWINEHLAQRLKPGTAERTQLDAVIDEATRLIGRFDLLTDLTLPDGTASPDPGPTPDAVHAITGLRFKLPELRITVPVPRAVVANSGPVVAETRASFTLSAGRGDADARLTLSDHAFGVPYGEYAWHAINVRARDRSGLDLRGELGAIFACDDLARSVAKRCVGPVCVGHESDLKDLCEGGLDQVVGKVHAAIIAKNFDAIRFKTGDANLRDVARGGAAGRDLRVDALDGVWDASIDAGKGGRKVPATFVGVRK